MADRADRHPWLDLMEVDGPFLSRPALDDIYDDAWPPKISSEQRDVLDLPDLLPGTWDAEAMEQVDRLLIEVLGYRDGRTLKRNPGTVIHPIYDNAIVSPYAAAYSPRDPDRPRLVVLAGPAAAETPGALDPSAITTHYGWPSTAVQRAALAARGLGADLALITNGWHHIIVWVGSGVTGYAWIDPSLYRLDHRLADAVVALLSSSSVTTDADASTADLLRLSQEKQVDLTEQLGLQVRRAAEALVNAVSRANRNTDGALLAGVAPRDVYAGVVTVLMRTVFLLNAEERDLVGGGDLWDRAYSVSALLGQLDDDHYRHQGVMRRRHGAWLRLLAAARAVHDGVNHAQMNVPAYGGNLFDPARHPFLEGIGVNGGVFDVGVVDDATVRHVLDLLQRLNGQRLSYRTFSVEQIGQVYESLLDHSVDVVVEGDVVLGLVGSKGSEAEVHLSDVEEQHTKGKLAEWLAANHDPSSGQGKVAKWQGRIDRAADERVTATLAQACNGDAYILDRLEPFVSLLRTDARGVALVALPGDVYVTETADRRDTGTAYTSPEFAADIAHGALEALIYEPGPHNEDDKTKWTIKKPGEILKLRVCDPAVGSGAILVAAVRYLAEHLVESRLEHGELMARELDTAALDPMATDPYVQAHRDVVAQCVYAVDRDPMAVEMCKLSLWLVTMAYGRPFTFVDHAIKCGDSLLGVTSLDQLRSLHLSESATTQLGLDLASGTVEGLGQYFATIDDRISRALALRELLAAGDVRDIRDAMERRGYNDQADRSIDDLRLVADAIAAICYVHASSASTTEVELRETLLPLVADIAANREALIELGQQRPLDAPDTVPFLHWALEFPEITSAGGFDAVLGNPPFIGGKKIKGSLGGTYRDAIVRYCADGSVGSADLVAYFFRRIPAIGKSFGLIATNSISQGDTRQVGLGPLTQQGSITAAEPSVLWPGRDAVHVARVWWARDARPTGALLDGVPVPRIASDLYPVTDAEVRPLSLPSNKRIAHIGQYLNGSGFVVPQDLAETWVRDDARNGEVLAVYVNGAYLNASRTQQNLGRRYAINFHDWDRTRAERFAQPFGHILREVKPHREGVARKVYRENWWKYAERQAAMLKAIDGLSEVIAVSATSAYGIPALVPSSAVLSHMLVVFATDDRGMLGVLTSTVHRVWLDRYCSTLGQGLRYTPTSGFATFPLPSALDAVDITMRQLEAWREAKMAELDLGLTDLYAHYHDRTDESGAVCELRDRHRALDRAVTDAYGWSHLVLDHGFHETRYGTFYTVSTEARYDLLLRLLALNLEQAAVQSGRSLEAVIQEAMNVV